MSTLAFTDCRFELNSVDLSDWLTQVELPYDFEALENTAMGQVARTRQGGLADSTIKVKLNNDFAVGAPDATLWAARNTIVVIKVRPTSSAIGATNPEYVGSYLINQIKPFGNSVGELATIDLSWPLSDADGIARNTS